MRECGVLFCWLLLSALRLARIGSQAGVLVAVDPAADGELTLL